MPERQLLECRLRLEGPGKFISVAQKKQDLFCIVVGVRRKETKRQGQKRRR